VLGEHRRQRDADLEALRGQRDGRLEDCREGHGAVATVGLRERRHHARDGHRQVPDGIGVVDDRHARPRAGGRDLASVDGPELVGTGGSGRPLVAVDHRGRPAGREVDHQVAAAADGAHRRLDHPQRERGRHGGVDRVAAAGQDLGPGLRGELVVGGHHPAVAHQRRLPELQLGFGDRPHGFGGYG
jgi:hypothetical protein